MHKFYLNECLPENISQPQFTLHLNNTLKEFNNLLNKAIDIERAIITNKLPSELIIGNTYTLQEVLESLHSHEIRVLAFSLFNRYPIGSHFDDTSPELIENNYLFAIEDRNSDATNLAIISLNDSFLLSPPLCKELINHPLKITTQDGESILFVNNFYGVEKNTLEIEEVILDINKSKLSLFEKLKFVIGDCILSSQFEKDFTNLTEEEQSSIIDYFEQAKERNLKTKFYPDTKIVKDVTPTKYKCSVYELRVYRPSALRVYFNESNEQVFLGSIEFKNTDNQDSEIKAAHSIIYKLILTN